MEKRLIIAIALSILVMLIYQAVVPRPKVTQPAVQKPVSLPPEKGAVQVETFQEPMAEVEEKDTIIETARYVLTFTNIGGSLKDVKLKEYPDPETGSPLQLVSDADGDRAIFSMASSALTRGLARRNFTLEREERNKIVYAYSIPGRFRVVKEYHFHNSNDYIGLRVSIHNLGDDIIYRDYDIIGASGVQSAKLGMGRRFLEINSMVDGKIIRSAGVKGGESLVIGIISWTGVKERYFCIILKPPQDSEGVLLRQFNKSDLASGIKTKRIPIYPGTRIEDSYILYIGPNDIARLKKLGLGLEQIVNYGVFGGITKFLLATLRTFHKVVRNWGVAIIMLTFLINMVLFPLTRKSFHSMRKIQEVQPHIEKLRKLHKDNPQRLNKELAELYRQYNVNPFGGCLPLFVQLPIFIALYQGLIRSLELKGANFLWIKDLSSPDYISIPFKLPRLGNQVPILPVVMVIAMFFQQRISTQHASGASKEQQQQQKFMLIFFPIFFGFIFIFGGFPSGLVLYWVTNTILMIIEHSAMRAAR